jgi:hypothetical protein
MRPGIVFAIFLLKQNCGLPEACILELCIFLDGQPYRTEWLLRTMSKLDEYSGMAPVVSVVQIWIGGDANAVYGQCRGNLQQIEAD